MARGFMGKILLANLSENRLQEETFDEEIGRRFIGGYGLGAWFLFKQQKAGIDALGPQNTLGFVSGMLTGTPALGSPRYMVVAKSPLTGGWGDANSGGYFGPCLKFSGYDAVFFTGISEKPVYLFLNNGKAELKDAGHLWGKDTFETEDILKAELGKNIEVACIGPSGEKQSLISAIMNNKGRAAGRSGLGAVMGSKKIKAIVVKGDMKVPLADEQKAMDLRKKYLKELTGVVQIFRDFGTPAFTVPHTKDGDSPVKNWGGTAVKDFTDAELNSLGVEHVVERRLKKYVCYQCPIGCGGIMKEGTGDYKYAKGSHRPEYETLAMFGPNCKNNNLDSIIWLNDVCNRYGLDTISTAATIAFSIECYENKLITGKDTDGIEMTWGNHRSIVAMTEKLAKREGFGDVLADGVKLAAERIGRGASKYAMHIQGQELPAHDPKCATELATTYKLDATPARHTQGSEARHAPGLVPEYDRLSWSGRAEIHKKGADFHHVTNSAGLCDFVYGTFPHVDVVAEFMRAVTGWDITTVELLQTGERIANLRQAFNIREGLNPVQFKIPDRIIGKPPKIAGPTAGVTVDEKTVYTEYLAAMDWDTGTGKPSKRKLLELGLEDAAGELYP